MLSLDRPSIRLAQDGDVDAVAALVRRAYEPFVALIGKPPGPMLEDYKLLVDRGLVHVLASGTVIDGLVVLKPETDHMLLDNVAVDPSVQGRGYGRALIVFAEAEARRQGLAEIRLYTNVVMAENIALYLRFGFVENGRGHENGYHRVFMSKGLT